MASSDDEGETFPDTVSDYYFCDGEDEPLSFSKLAVQWDESESSSGDAGPIFLRGTADNGLQKLYKQVKAWKYDFSNANPEISVFSKDNNWIKLQKPRKSFENVIRTILITVHCLHFFKSKPEASGKALWDHLSKVFRLYDVRPSENDLIDHMNFIREAVKRDETLAKSKYLAAFLEDNPRKRKVSDEDAETATKPSFIVDDMNDEPQDDDCVTKETEDSESDEEDDVFDSVCAICDNGGQLTCCDGKCLRCFHANVDIEEAEESNCESLGLPAALVKGTQSFLCENCKYNQHQCFVCGKLGSSDRSSVAEVFRCSSATCGHFYHPKCVAVLLQRKGESELQDLQEKIGAGEPFTCPVHKCVVCKQAENENVKDLQFAVCRRCPTSYHRKCLPSEIMFDNEVGDGDDDVARAWDDLLPKSRALIYCLNHEIDEELGTPARNLIFRDILNIKKKQSSELLLNKKRVAVKEKGINSANTSKKRSVLKSQEGVKTSSAVKLVDSSKKRAASSTGPESLKKKRVADTAKSSLKRTLSTKGKAPSSNDSQPSLGSRLYEYMNNSSKSINSEKDVTSIDDDKQTMTHEDNLPPIDADSKQRILALMKDASSSITLDEVKRYHKDKVPSTHAHSSKVDKSIILARVEGSVEALHLALKKLEGGCSIEDAMAVCEPGVLDQIMRWKEKLRIYLSPFLHGMRYTSFGRHFTKVEKLEKIVDKLRWYVEDGDTIVDFCCGANDFSCLMKERLDEMGKRKCSYKNYDFTRPKNDFNFERRDWMTVNPKELPSGSRLIMGLNPPFGKNATLANKFIDKALRFKPKLLVLIVPPETERLDHENKQIPYELVWEDAELLAGKSFYFPGSVDVNDKQMDQWNNTPPPLYLWSRPDWASKHKTIAQKNGHISEARETPHIDENVPSSDLKNENELKGDFPVINNDSERTTENAKPNMKRSRKKGTTHDNDRTKSKEKQKSYRNSKKRNRRNQEYPTKKRDNKHSPAPTRQDQDQARETPALTRQDQVRKTPPTRQERARETPVLTRQDQARETPVLIRQDRARETLAPTRQDQVRETLALTRQDRARDTPPPTGQERACETPTPTCQDPSRETPYLDYSFGNNAGQSFDQHLETRYTTTTEEPYVGGGAVYRRPEGGAYTTPGYSMRTEPIHYGGYERGGMGSYLDEMGARGSYLRGHLEPGLAGYSSSDASLYNRATTSAMQRYAPRLDELNHARMGNYGRPEPPPVVGPGPGPGSGPGPGPGMGGYGASRPGPEYRMDSMGFAPGPYHLYSQRNSSGGWLND